MNEQNDALMDVDPHFFSIVLSLSSAAMQQLGKMPNPMSRKIERNLMQAQLTIDMLVMLKNKTKGNLTQKEDQLLKNTLSDLQLNYADEAAQEEKSKLSPKKSETPPETTPETTESTSENIP